MKLFFLSSLLFFCFLKPLFAQEKINHNLRKDSLKPKNSKDGHNYYLGLGLNVLDSGISKLPINASSWSINTPFYISLERTNIISNFSAVLSFSTNRLKVNSIAKFYYSIDASARYYFDDNIFNNTRIERYVGLGLGRFFLENKGNNTLNLMVGGRYWFLKNLAISVELAGKMGLKPKNIDVLNHYAYNFGLVWSGSLRKKISLDTSKMSPIDAEQKIIKREKEILDLTKIFIKEKETLVIKESEIGTIQDKSIPVFPLAKPKMLEIVDTKSSVYNLPAKSLSDYVGNWYIKITNSKNNKLIISHSFYSTYAPSEKERTIWISDLKKGVWLQCMITLNLAEGTFTATEQPNTLDEGTVTITEGKFGKRKGISKAGNIVDKIYFKAEFSYDPGSILIFEGHKSTGLKEDKY
jgi:hypothetical protein